MKIGELAKRTGLATSAIRFYESKGLLNAVGRQTNGYREYTPEAVAILSIVVSAQQTGFSLDEIKQVLPDDFSHWQHDKLLLALKAKVRDIETMAARLAKNKAQLASLIELMETKPEEMACQDNASRIMDRLGIGITQGG